MLLPFSSPGFQSLPMSSTSQRNISAYYRARCCSFRCLCFRLFFLELQLLPFDRKFKLLEITYPKYQQKIFLPVVVDNIIRDFVFCPKIMLHTCCNFTKSYYTLTNFYNTLFVAKHGILGPRPTEKLTASGGLPGDCPWTPLGDGLPDPCLASRQCQAEIAAAAVCCTVCEIFNVEWGRALETFCVIARGGHLRSLEMTTFDRPHVSCYRRTIVTMALSSIVFEIKRNICRKSLYFHTQPTFDDAPVRGFPSEYCYKVWHGKKLEWWVYQVMKKVENRFTRVDTIHERDRQTDTARQHRRRAAKIRQEHSCIHLWWISLQENFRYRIRNIGGDGTGVPSYSYRVGGIPYCFKLFQHRQMAPSAI